MNNPRFVYCFSKTLAANKERYEVSLQLFKKSVELISKHYSAKVYTDSKTIDDLRDLQVPVVDLGELDLVFVDDIKIHCINLLEEDEILIDVDILVLEKLKIDLTSDIIFDFIDSPDSWWYEENFEELSYLNFKEKLHQISIPNFVPNIGFLKINDTSLLKTYTDLYYNFRSSLLEQHTEDNNINRFSMLLGQYLLGSILTRDKYSFFNMSSLNKPVDYIHLSGPAKYGEKPKRNNG